jgi:hypothetical protein
LPAPAEEAPAAEAPPQPTAAEEPAPPAPEPAEEPKPAAESMAPRNLSDASPSPLPPRKPEVLPPPGGFSYDVEESKRSKLRTAIPIALAGAIAGLIAVLAWRRKN